MTGIGAITACNNSSSSSNNHGNYHRRRDGVQPTAAAQRPLRDITLIELNNRALDLLQAGFCRLCIDTFKDALELMKTTTPSSNTVDDANRYRNQYASMVDRAESRRRTAAAQQQQQSSHNQHSPMAATPPHGLLVFSSDHDATEVYNMLATVRTARVALTMRTNDPNLDFASLKAILVYNYGMAHRCCPLVTNQTTGSTNWTSLQNFCLQIFQYAETLTPTYCDNLLFRFILTRNLMMLSCRLGMSLCEHYKETLDPIERAIRGPILPPDHDHGPHEAAAA
jgi:hypothetical protein